MAPQKTVTKPLAFVLIGEPGKTAQEQVQITYPFKPESLFALDTAERLGCGARIQIYWGTIVAFPAPIPVWAFSGWVAPEERDAYETAAKLVGTKFETEEARQARDLLRLVDRAAQSVESATVPAGMVITMQATFTESCRVEAVVFGKTLQ